jgi:hypothetical protein
MSMYTDLLTVALSEDHLGDGQLTTGERLANFLRHRSQLEADDPSHTGTGWAPAGIAHQMAYDVALIELARSLGVACDPMDFDQMQPGRARLEADLKVRGVPLDGLEEPSRSVSPE